MDAEGFEQYDGGIPPYVRGSDTSEDAARSLTRINAKQRLVYEYLARCGTEGATDEEMQRFVPMEASTQRPRRVELVERGAAVDSGRRRLTVAKRRAVVWIIGPVVPAPES